MGSAPKAFMTIENTACIVVEKDGKVLLVKRANRVFRGWWCIPGGYAEPGETPHQNAQREANEEIGSVAVEDKPFLVFLHDWPADRDVKVPHKHRCYTFRARITGELRAGDDAAELGWFTPEQAGKLKLTNYTETILKHLRE
jgi:ADP-ribose pyrophosphatase YjhB (NUDIX family)